MAQISNIANTIAIKQSVLNEWKYGEKKSGDQLTSQIDSIE